MRYALPISSPDAFGPKPETIKIEVHDWRGIEGEHLAENEAADNGDSEWPTKLIAHPSAQC